MVFNQGYLYYSCLSDLVTDSSQSKYFSKCSTIFCKIDVVPLFEFHSLQKVLIAVCCRQFLTLTNSNHINIFLTKRQIDS